MMVDRHAVRRDAMMGGAEISVGVDRHRSFAPL
jgi:hypothetical protein